MKARRSIWFTVDLDRPLTDEEQMDLLEHVAHWDYGTFLVVRTEALHTCSWVHDLLERVLCESPLAVCIADDVIRILDRLEVHYNSIQD